MSELLDKIIEAKGVLGDRQAEIIAEGYPLEEWNPEKGSAKSIFNANDNTPSMMWMKKDYYFKDFSTGKVFGILDYYMYKFHEPYMKSVKRLLDETGVKYSSSLFNFVSTTEQKDYFKNFRYPHAENDISGVALEYMAKRGISEDTCRYVGLGCDHNGNVAYQFHDLTGKVVTVKYRPSHAVKHGEPKYFYQKNADTCPILYNIDRIDPTKPVLITEGMCFPGDAEVMTADGWVRLDKYNDTEVMQVNSDGSCEFAMPIAKIAHEYNGEFVVTDRGGNYYSATTSDHNIVVNTCGTLVKRKVGDMPNSIEGTIPTTAIYCGGDGIDLSDDEIRLFVAFSADGCYNNASYYVKSNKKRIRFIFAKKRKFDRLKEILERIGVEYTETKHEYDRYTTGIKYYIGFEDKKKYLNKVFPWQWIKDMTKHQREVFLDELCFWDGYKFNNRNMGEYYSEIKSNVDFVQAMCHTSGFMATIKHRKDREKNCSVSMLYSKNHVSWQNMWSSGSAKRIKYSGMVYCLTVPSGMLVVRQNEKIAVTGNCDAMACIEAGFKNVVSIPSGANDDNWINFNYEFLDQFEDIILWFDNDDAGESGMKKAIPRLGEYRIKIVKPTEDDEEAVYNYYHSFNENVDIRKTDANNVLLACGSARILALINSAEEIPMESVIDLMDVEEFDIEQTEYIPSGINSLDRQIYGFIDGTLNIWTAYSGCVDCDTEFFDGTKWKRIADFQNGDKVLQYNDDGTAELVTPSVFHKYKCDYLWHFKTKYGINQCLSEEHNVYYLNQDGKLMSLPFAEVKRRHESNKEGFTGRFIKAFNYGGVGIGLSDAEIKLMCAVICDGTFTHNKTNLCRFHLKKDRKKVEVRKIFSECGIEYTERESSANGYTDFYFYAPRREKEFTDYWYNCSHEQLKVICDNIMFWDGSVDKVGRMRFSTSVKVNADFVQFAYTSCGYRATIRVNDRSGQKYFTCGKWYTRKSCEYYVSISTRTTASMSCSSAENKAKIEKYETKDGFKYCFTVPSHKWIMRRGNDIVVTGNCGKTTMISQTVVLEAIDKGNTVFWFNAESTTSQMLNWVLAQAAGRQHSVEYTGANGFQFYKPTPQATQAIKQYYAKKIFVYDNLLLSNPDMVFNKMKEVYKRFGTKVFVLDNWLCLNFRGISDTEVTGIQVDFMNKLIHFTKQNGLEVHLVCHPRKQQAGIPLSEYEILGTSNIVNMADRIYGLEKVWDNDLKAQGYDRQFTVFKDRTLGIHGERIGLRYDRVTRRLYGDGDDKFKQYSWDKGLIRYNSPIFGKNGLLVGDRVLDYEQAAANNTPY